MSLLSRFRRKESGTPNSGHRLSMSDGMAFCETHEWSGTQKGLQEHLSGKDAEEISVKEPTPHPALAASPPVPSGDGSHDAASTRIPKRDREDEVREAKERAARARTASRLTAMLDKEIDRRKFLTLAALGAGLGGTTAVVESKGGILKSIADALKKLWPVGSAKAAPGAGAGGTTISSGDIDAKRIMGIRVASNFAPAGSSSPFPLSGLSGAVSDLGGNPGVVYVDSTIDVTASYTVPSNVHLLLSGASLLKPETGVTLTINGPFEAPLSKVFSLVGTGVAVFGAGAVERCYPQWWGAKGDGVADDSAAIQSAIDAAGSAGGIVWCSRGIYALLSTLTVSNPRVSILGEGQGGINPGNTAEAATVLLRAVNNSATDVLVVTSAASGFRMEDLAIGTFSTVTYQCRRVLDLSSGVNGLTSVYINDCKIWGSNAGATRFAQDDTIRADLSGPNGSYISNCNIRGGNAHALHFLSLTDDLFLENLVITAALLDGLYLQACKNVWISQIIADSNRNGIHLESISDGGGMTIVGGRMSRNNQHGILIDGTNPTLITILGVQAHDNSNSPVQTYNGISIQNSSKVTIKGCRCLNTAGGSNQLNGIEVKQFGGGAVDSIEIEGNMVSPNFNAGIVTSGVITNLSMRNNHGFNPQGVAVITVGASPFTYTNNDGVPEAIYIDGGTVSAIAKNATTIYTSTGKTVWLEPGESVTVTYSVAPTMTKDRK